MSLVSAFAGMSFVLLSPFHTPHKGNAEISFFEMMARGLYGKMGRPINLLVIGVDRVLGVPEGSPESFRGRADTILLVRLDPDNNTITVLSIPRDSRVEIPGYGVGKINAANVYGDAPLTAKVVSQTLNYTPVDRYIRIGPGAFRALVDLVGGVEINVPKRMYYTDDTQKLYIDLYPGLQTLNGEQAEGFVRFRYDDLGDIGRAQRQQMLIKALQKKLASPIMLTRLPQLYEVLKRHVDTDLSFGELMAIAQFSLRTDPENLRMILLPGQFSGDGYDASYWLLDHEGIARIVETYFTPRSQAVTPSPPWIESGSVRIALQNASGTAEAAQDMADFLRYHGYTNVMITDDWYQEVPVTQVLAQQGDLGAAQMVRSVLGVGQVLADSTGVISSDVTVRIGRDWVAIVH